MATQTDPVCGMTVDDQKAPTHSTYEGKTYYFCGADCKGKWDANPMKYAPKKAAV
jgi:Cu+-exporting ATPase